MHGGAKAWAEGGRKVVGGKGRKGAAREEGRVGKKRVGICSTPEPQNYPSPSFHKEDSIMVVVAEGRIVLSSSSTQVSI